MQRKSCRSRQAVAAACAGALVLLTSTACDEPKRAVEGDRSKPSSSTEHSATGPPESADATNPTDPAKPTVPRPPTPTNRPPHKTPVEPAPRKVRTIRGQITEAVEAGCLVLSTSEGTFTLIDPPGKLRTLEVGTEIVVRGTVPRGSPPTASRALRSG